DHLDNYGEPEAVVAAFREFADRLPDDGCLVLGADDDAARSLAEPAVARGVRVVTFGLAADADVRIENLELHPGGSRFEIVAGGRRLGDVALQVPGDYNAVNAAGTL